MKVTHSVNADAVYIAFKEIAFGESAVQHAVVSDKLRPEVILDIDTEGRLIGIEVLGATEGLPPEFLEAADERIDL